MTLEFTVRGTPQPQGSMRQIPIPGQARPILTSDNPQLKEWRTAVANEAMAEIQRRSSRPEPFRKVAVGPVAIVAMFYLPRPKYLKDRVAAHVVKPDVDKLIRAACDAMSTIVWHDDAQVTDILARKRYTANGQPARAQFIISTLSEV